MASEPGPHFRWGLVTRRSAYNLRTTEGGEVERYEDSTSRQEHVLHGHIQANGMGVSVVVAQVVPRDARQPPAEPCQVVPLAHVAVHRGLLQAAWSSLSSQRHAARSWS